MPRLTIFAPKWVCTALALVAICTGPALSQDGAVERIARQLEQQSHQRLMSVVAKTGATLSPFHTDGCSGGLSSLWNQTARRFPAFETAHGSKPPWESCCITHDRAYHAAGGTADWQSSYDARRDADRFLQICVAEIGQTRAEALAQDYGIRPDQIKTLYAGIASAMYIAVRAGGSPCSGLPWRWGYGYDGCILVPYQD